MDFPCPVVYRINYMGCIPSCSAIHSKLGNKMLQGETLIIMFVYGAEAPSTNITDMVSPYAPGLAL